MKYKILNPANLLIYLTIAVAWLFTAKILSPFLLYNSQQIAFISGMGFLSNYVNYPGGIADYFAEFVSQFFYFNTFGSLIIVLTVSLQGFILLHLAKRISGEIKLKYLIFNLVLISGLILFFDHHYPFYITIRLLFAFLFVWIFSLLQCKFPKYVLGIWLLSALLLFYLASGPALFVFAVSTSIIFLSSDQHRSKWYFVPVFIVFAAIVPYVGFELIFQTSLSNLYKIAIMKPPAMLTYTSGIPAYVYYALLPVILAGVFTYKKLSGKRPVPEKKVLSKGINPIVRFFSSLAFLLILQFVFSSFVAFALYKKYYDSFNKNLMLIDYYAENQQWAEVLKTTKNISTYDFRVNFQGLRALSHLGQLPDRLFEYPELLGTYGLFVDATMANSMAMPTSDLYFDLGLISESQHWAFEAQTLQPNSPRILKRLILINIINRKYKLAGEFLGILDRNMLYRDWVKKYKKFVADPTLADKDPMIADKRKLSPTKTDIFVNNEEGLKILLEANPANKLAYEYAMSYYILDLNLGKFARYLSNYKAYNYKKLPKSWEEALCIYVVKANVFPENIPSDAISKTCLKNFDSFTKIMNQYKNNPEAGKKASYGQFGSTYWYYLVYLNPQVTNVLKEKKPVK